MDVFVEIVQVQLGWLDFLGCTGVHVLIQITTVIINRLQSKDLKPIHNVLYRIVLAHVMDVTVVLVRDIMHFLVKVEQDPMRWEETLTVKVTTVELDGFEYVTVAYNKLKRASALFTMYILL